MIQTYRVPPNITEQEKIIGGVLTIAQTVLLVLAAVIALVCLQFLYNTFNSIIIALFGVIPAVPFVLLAFLKKHEYGDMDMPQYLIYRLAYKKSKKAFPNVNENFMGE